MKKQLLAAVFTSSLVLALGACGGDDKDKEQTTTTTTTTDEGGNKTTNSTTTTTDGNTDESAASGAAGSSATASNVDAEKIVNAKCVMCHGQNLEGQGSFPKIANAGARLSKDEIKAIVINGKGAMPAQISDEAEADAVAQWLSEKK